MPLPATKQTKLAQRPRKKALVPSQNIISQETLAAILAAVTPSLSPKAGDSLGAPAKGTGGHGGPRLIRASVADILYTADALAAKFEGALLVDLAINEFGEVVAAALRNPSGLMLDDGVLAAAKSAQYKPAMDADGQPTASGAQLRFNFQLSDVGRRGISAAH
jgi:outer membrane biosynthesis protein TonB